MERWSESPARTTALEERTRRQETRIRALESELASLRAMLVARTLAAGCEAFE